MTAPVSRRALTDNLRAMLAAATTKQIGDHQAPDTPVYPYGILYARPLVAAAGPVFTDPQTDVRYEYQVTSVGIRRDQAEWMADKARTALISRTATGAFSTALTPPAGWIVLDRSYEGGGGVDLQGDPKKLQLWTVTEVFSIALTPS